MNSIKNLSILLIFLAAFSFGSCGGSNTANTENEGTESMEADKSGAEYTSAYVCPMHCKGSGSDKAGTCPVCKMDYVVNEDYHDHDSHEGHNH